MKIFQKKLIKIGLIFVLSCVLIGGLINIYIFQSTKNNIYKNISDLPDGQQVIIVLGARVKSGGIISDMLKDRIETAIQVLNLKLGILSGNEINNSTLKTQNLKLLVSADNGKSDYDEVRPTRDYLINKGVKSDLIFLDFAGFDTYDSLYRAKYIFQVKSAIISTQAFHLPRAVYICKNLGLECYGIIADKRQYITIRYNQARELLANIKAFFNILFRSKSHFLGEQIPITGSGNAFLY